MIYRLNEDFFDDTEITSASNMVDDDFSIYSSYEKSHIGYTCVFKFYIMNMMLELYDDEHIEISKNNEKNIYKIFNNVRKFMECMDFVDECDARILFAIIGGHSNRIYKDGEVKPRDITDYIDKEHSNALEYMGNIIKLMVNPDADITDCEYFTHNGKNTIWFEYSICVYVKPADVSLRKLYSSVIRLLDMVKNFKIGSLSRILADKIEVVSVEDSKEDLNRYMKIHYTDNISETMLHKLYKFIYNKEYDADEKVSEIVRRKYNIDGIINETIGKLPIDINKWGYAILDMQKTMPNESENMLPVLVVDILPNTIGNTTRESVVKSISNNFA